MTSVLTLPMVLALAPAEQATTAQSTTETPWIERFRPERNMWELGVFGGVMFPHPRLELFEPREDQPDQGFQPLVDVVPEFGLRVAYFPFRVLGAEVEGAWLPGETAGGSSANLLAARGHALAQVARWRIAPFALAGVSGLAVLSDGNALGNDIDMGFHYGGGVKYFASRWLVVRVDVRDTLTARRGVDTGVVHSPEILLGLGITLGRKKQQDAIGDLDQDGIYDPYDKCVDVPGVRAYEGCPIPDSDKDGVFDPSDECVNQAGVAAYAGCPVPDSDGDGILDPEDKCVSEPGPADYAGCPIPDSDGDGILDPQDKCVSEPEVVNGIDDEDGCPDELPDEVKQFTGVIEGIYFDTAKATIKSRSNAKLDNVVDVLQRFPQVRIEVSGHTDDRGDADYNQELSEQRANAVKAYIVGKGIDGSRLTTRGAGETQPRESNDSRAGRAKNRRIEFKLLQR